MVVAGGIAADARVRKSAQTVQRLGYDVTLLYGLRKITTPVRGNLGDVTTIGLPLLSGLARTKATLELEAKVKQQQVYRPAFPGFASQVRYEWARYQNELAGLSAAGHPTFVRAFLRVPRLVFRWREKVHLRRVARASRQPSVRPVSKRVDWEAEVPLFSDLSLTFTKEIWRHKPDIIHAHDANVLKAAVHAMQHLRAHGRRPALVYDAHEFIAGSVRKTERLTLAWAHMEKQYIKEVDAVITVSESIADALQRRYSLAQRPTVVLNAPSVTGAAEASSDVRTDCALDSGVPLAVYTGSTKPQRGVATAVEALAFLPEVHLAIVCVPNVAHKFSQQLLDHAQRSDVADRVHLVEPVRPEEVLHYLRTADVGVHPLIGDIPNHEMALPNKLFDYVFAGLPVVVSDLQEMGAFVRRTGVGEPFAFGDAADCARALKEVCGSLDAYRDRIRAGHLEASYAWESQEAQLECLYQEVAAGGHRRPTPAGGTRAR